MLASLDVFQDLRRVNQIGVAAGNVLQFGAELAPGSSRYNILGIFVKGRRTCFTPCPRNALASVNPQVCASGALRHWSGPRECAPILHQSDVC